MNKVLHGFRDGVDASRGSLEMKFALQSSKSCFWAMAHNF